jgi:nucleoside-diphosphate kinase
MTFCIIKPDALERAIVGRIITRIEDTYLRIFAVQMRHKNEEWCRLHYQHVVNEPFFPNLVAFMTARPILGFTVHGPNAIIRMKKLVGATQQAAPGTIRGDFGSYPAMFNCIHCSGSQEEAERELKLFMDLETDFSLQEIKNAGNALQQRR